MKFVTFNEKDFTRAGVLLGYGVSGTDRIVDLAHPSMRRALLGTPPRMQALIEAGLPDLVASIGAHGLMEAAKLPRDAVTLMAPLPEPRNIFGIAHNYRDALAERGMPPPDKPVLFMKAPRTITGPGQPIVLPAGIGGVTYEAELAAVIGSRADKVGKDRALDHVVAYGCFNDISASEIIKADGHFDRGKNFPTFGPFWPLSRLARRGAQSARFAGVAEGRRPYPAVRLEPRTCFSTSPTSSPICRTNGYSNPATSLRRAHRQASRGCTNLRHG